MKKIVPFSKEIAFQTKIAEITDIEVTHNLEVSNHNTIEGSFLVNGKYRMSDASSMEEEFHYDLPFTIEVDDKYDLSDIKIKINDFYFEIINEDVLKVNVELELSEVQEKEKVLEEEELLVRCYEEDTEAETNDDTKEIDEINDAKVLKTEDVEEEKARPVMELLKEIKKPSKKDGATVDIIEPIDILDEVLPEMLSVQPANTTSVSKKQNISLSKGEATITNIFPTISDEEDTFQSYYVYIVRENDTLEGILDKYQTTRDLLLEYNNLDDIKLGTKLIIPCSFHE